MVNIGNMPRGQSFTASEHNQLFLGGYTAIERSNEAGFQFIDRFTGKERGGWRRRFGIDKSSKSKQPLTTRATRMKKMVVSVHWAIDLVDVPVSSLKGW